MTSDFRKTVLACLAGIGLSLVILGPQLVEASKQENDFRHFYLGALLARRPYDPQLAAATQIRVLVHPDLEEITLNRLPFYYAFLSPLERLPFGQAMAVWVLLLALALVTAVFLWPHGRSALAIAMCWSLPLYRSLLMKQDIALLVLVVAAGERLRTRGHTMSAGAIFSLALVKWHLFLLLPLLFLIRRERRLLAGFLSGAAALLAASFLDAGRAWPVQYYSILRNELHFGSAGEWVTIHSIALHLGANPWVELAGSGVVAVTALVAMRKAASFEYALTACLIGGILLSRHACVWDCGLMVPSLTWLAGRAMRVATPAFALLSPLIYLFPYAKAAWVIGVAFCLMLAAMAVEASNDRRKPGDPGRVEIPKPTGTEDHRSRYDPGRGISEERSRAPQSRDNSVLRYAIKTRRLVT